MTSYCIPCAISTHHYMLDCEKRASQRNHTSRQKYQNKNCHTYVVKQQFFAENYSLTVHQSRRAFSAIRLPRVLWQINRTYKIQRYYLSFVLFSNYHFRCSSVSSDIHLEIHEIPQSNVENVSYA